MYDVVKYVIDSNVLIESHRFYYHSDFFREFWDYMSVLIERRIVFIPPEVALEIEVGKDFLSKSWLRTVERITEDVEKDIAIFEEVKEVVENSYISEKAQQFFQGADPHVISWAIQLEAYIVTNEKPSGQVVSEKRYNKYNARVKIPDVVMLLERKKSRAPKGIVQLWDIVRDMKETFLVEKPYKLGENAR